MIHVFVLIMTIGGAEVANDDCREAMCFRSIDTCNSFAAKTKTTRFTQYLRSNHSILQANTGRPDSRRGENLLMAAEIVAAVQICASAYRFMKTAVNEGRELGDMTRAMSKFWDAREEVSVLEQKATNPSKIEKLFGGKSVESQALEITLQKKKAEQLEKELKDLFYWTGNANLWHDMIRERAKIRNLRIAAARQKAQNRAAMIDIAVIGGILGLLMVTVLAITSVAVE